MTGLRAVYLMLRVIRSAKKMESGSGGKSIGPVAFLNADFVRTIRRFALLFFCACSAQLARAQSWERLGPPGGMVISLAAAPNGEVYLGTADGHVFASADRGEHWELRGRAGGRLDGVVQRMVPDTQRAGRALAAVWFRDAPGGGVFESLDGARHWKLAGLGDEAVRALEHAESDPAVWLAGTRRGVFRSDDDGKTWRRLTAANDPELLNIDSLAIDPRDAKTIYVGTYHLPWKSTDGGRTWTSIAAGMIDDSDIMSLRIDAQNPRRIFSSACSGIYRSDDGGANWVKLQGIPYSSRRTQQITQDPDDPRILYAATTEGLWATADAGETWKRITGRETDANAVVVLTVQKGNRLLVGFDAQGVFRSDDGGQSFTQANAGFSHRVVFSLANDREEARHLLARAEGFGGALVETRDLGATWAELPGNAGKKRVDRVFALMGGWWATLEEGGIAKFNATKSQWTEVPFRELIMPPAPRRPRSQGRGRRFQQISPRVVTLVEAGDVIFAAADRGLWKGGPTAASFEKVVAQGLPAAMVSLSISPQGSLLAIDNGGIWTGNPGATGWTEILPPANVGALLWCGEWQINGQTVRLLGTERGVFSAEPGTSWRLLSNGLPAISSRPPVTSDGRIVVAMSNGGIYVSADELKSWRRIEEDSEQSQASALLATPEGVLVVSRAEGVLLLKVPKGN
jgi:photosystem II stability/assembly factor-like uncharacterized protein